MNHKENQEEFTMIALDLPGYGQSESSGEIKSDPTLEYFELCAQVGAKLMSQLGHKTYSLAGWSDGARVASLLAIRNQSRVNCLLLWAFVPVMDRQSCQAIARTRDISIWDREVLQFYSSVYGEQQFSDLWRRYVDFNVAALELPDQFDLRDELSKIKCPTLVLHGREDPIVSFKEHVKPLEWKIYDSDIKQFNGLAHNIHQADPEMFNGVLTSFVTTLAA